MQNNSEWKIFEEMWRFNVSNRVAVTVNDGEKPVVNVKVELLDQSQKVIFAARTDNNGIAYLFNNLNSADIKEVAFVRASKLTSDTKAFDPSIAKYDFTLSDQATQKNLDLMLVIDTTGSMGDEISFLKAELDNVIQQVNKDNPNLNIRLSINAYRDISDDYVVRSTPFEKNINNQLEFLNNQFADGGGDYEEAVEQALADAIEQHDWDKDATAKLMLLVLDAPPHNTDKISAEMHRLVNAASEEGIRIIPIASSGVDKNTEFLLRTLSMVTGGTYVFLTDHSGIGNPHIEPTIGAYDVELLNELIVRLINGYLE